jgi:hypothetical protein
VPRHDAFRLVEDQRQLVVQLARRLLQQGQRLAGFDLLAGDGSLAIDLDQAFQDQRVCLAARADAFLGQPFIDAQRLSAFISFGPGHDVWVSCRFCRLSYRPPSRPATDALTVG